MLKTLKNIILVDETQPLEQIKKGYKSRVYWFLSLSLIVSFLLIFLIPENIMRYDWAKSFVAFMGYLVPMVDGLEHIRLYGSSDPYKAHLIVLPHISFYYALLWACAWVSVPYIIVLTKGNFDYNKDSDMIGTKTLIEHYHNKKFFYYLRLCGATALCIYAYTLAGISTRWFVARYIYHYSVAFVGSASTIFIAFSFIAFIYTHFLIRQQDKNHENNSY